MRFAEYEWVIQPYLRYSYFLDQLTLLSPSGNELDIRDEIEVGFRIQTEPRYKIWKLKLPRLEFRYTYSDGAEAFKLGLGS